MQSDLSTTSRNAQWCIPFRRRSRRSGRVAPVGDETKLQDHPSSTKDGRQSVDCDGYDRRGVTNGADAGSGHFRRRFPAGALRLVDRRTLGDRAVRLVIGHAADEQDHRQRDAGMMLEGSLSCAAERHSFPNQLCSHA